MTWRTLTHRGPKNKAPNRTHCLVCWPEEGDSLSIVAVKKIVTPRLDDLAPDTFCKVKGLEKYLCKVVSLGTECAILFGSLFDNGIDISLRTILRCRTALGWTFRGSAYC
jgi:hypothetical protein